MNEDAKDIIRGLVIILLISGFTLVYHYWGTDLGIKNPSAKAVAKDMHKECMSAGGDSFKDSKSFCYAGEMSDVAYNHGPSFAFEVLTVLQRLDSSAEGCHFIAHGIGYGTFDRAPEDWHEATKELSRRCGYGAIHGVMEKHFNVTGDQLTQENITEICGDNPKGACNHGVGHLTLVESEGDIDKALKLCDAFEDDMQRYLCKTGTFMEHIIALNLIEHSIADESWLDWAERVPELEKLCRSYEGEEAAACWRELPHAAMSKFENDVRKMVDMCATAQSKRAVQKCANHTITSIYLAARGFNMSKVQKEACRVDIPQLPNFDESCSAGLASAYLSMFPHKIQRAIDYCLSLEGRFKSRCMDRVGQMLNSSFDYSKQEISRVCENILEGEASWCRP